MAAKTFFFLVWGWGTKNGKLEKRSHSVKGKESMKNIMLSIRAVQSIFVQPAVVLNEELALFQPNKTKSCVFFFL